MDHFHEIHLFSKFKDLLSEVSSVSKIIIKKIKIILLIDCIKLAQS